MSGFCVVSDLFAWVSVTDPNVFHGTNEAPIPWLVVVVVLSCAGALCLLGMCPGHPVPLRCRTATPRLRAGDNVPDTRSDASLPHTHARVRACACAGAHMIGAVHNR